MPKEMKKFPLPQEAQAPRTQQETPELTQEQMTEFEMGRLNINGYYRFHQLQVLNGIKESLTGLQTTMQNIGQVLVNIGQALENQEAEEDSEEEEKEEDSEE